MTIGYRFGYWALILPLVVAFAIPASAHDRTTSYSSWELTSRQARVVLTVAEVDLRALSTSAGTAERLAVYAPQRLVMTANGSACRVAHHPRSVSGPPPGRVALEWTVLCDADGPLRVQSNLLLESYPGHLHFAKVSWQQRADQRVLTQTEPSWDIEFKENAPAGASILATLGKYWALGVEHIATGYDHLVFLLALLLSGGNLLSLVKVVSGFTVGHSLTLALASLGVVQADVGPIEALIGLSIAFVAVENVWLRSARGRSLPIAIIAVLLAQGALAAYGVGRLSWLSCFGMALFVSCYYSFLRRSAHPDSTRWILASIFGLIHGFGFASVLRAAELPEQYLPIALAGFSLGVESGQIVLVAVAWPVLRKVLSISSSVVVELGSSLALCLGVYWMLQRAYL